MAERARLLHLSGRSAGKVSVISERSAVLGRDPRASTLSKHLQEEGVSRQHAQIWSKEGAWWIRDLGSANGTTLDGQPVSEPVPLPPGAVIGLGLEVTLRFEARAPQSRASKAPAPPPLDTRRLPSRLAFVALLVAMVLAASAWGWEIVRAGRAQRAAERESLRGQVWHDLAAGARPGALRERLLRLQALGPPEVDGPGQLSADPLHEHIRRAMSALTGQPLNRAVDRFFREEVERQILGLYQNTRCACRLAALRSELLAILQEELRNAGAPESRAEILLYIPWIESCYRCDACSPAAARGMWQFIPKTARRYGLTVTDTVDERCDWRKATRAAARYFVDTFRLCGDAYPLLAIAAYNTGEARACTLAADPDLPSERRDVLGFIAEGYLLPETVTYVPRFVAASFVGEHPAEALALASKRSRNISTEQSCEQSASQIPSSAPCASGMMACPDQREKVP